MVSVFDKFPPGNICPVCGTNKTMQTILVPIDNCKHNDGLLVEVIPTHLMCILNNIRYSRSHQLMGLEADKGE